MTNNVFVLLSRPENYLSIQKVKATGLQHVRLGNVGVFARTEEDQRYLVTHVEQGAY